MEEFTRTFTKLIGGQANGRWVLIAGLVLAFLAALPDLIPTITALLGALPIRESTVESLRKGLQSVRKWSRSTRIVMIIIGVVLIVLGVMVVTAKEIIANPDERTTRQYETITFNVLTNDHDPDGSQIILISYTPVSANGGDVECTRDGACTYTPPARFVGDDIFTYNISYGVDKFIYGVLVTIHVEESPTTPTWTASPSATHTATLVPTATPTPTYTLTASPSPTNTGTPTATATPTLTSTPSDTPTPGPSPTPTPTIPVTNTFTPTTTSTPTLTPTPTTAPSLTPTPTVSEGEAFLTTLARLNVRRGPGFEYGYPLTALGFGVTVRILGVSMDEGWWKIDCPSGIDSPTGCWVTSDPEFSITRNTESVPVVPPPPTPTPAG